MAASLLSDAATFALRVSFGRAIQKLVPTFFLHGPTAAPARSRLLDAAVGVLVDTVIGVLHITLGRAIQQHVTAFSNHAPTAAPASNRVLEAAVGALIETVVGVLVDKVIGVLRVAFGRALPQHVPAFSIHGPIAAPASNSILDAAVGVLIDTVIGFLLDTVIGFLVDTVIGILHVAFARAVQQLVPAFSIHGPTAAPASNSVLDAAAGILIHTVPVDLQIALPAAFLVVVLTALLLVLFACCVVAALAATVFYLEPAAAFRRRERQLAVLALVPLFPLAVAVVILDTVLWAVRSEDM